jgi:excisionase family DNA binding protein
MVKQNLPRKPGASIPELAKDFGVSEATLYNLANREELPGARRVGRRILVHRATFEAWIAAGHGR